MCSFILTLSLIWNDLKNIFLFIETLHSCKPNDDTFDDPNKMPVNPQWGEIAGIEVYLEKSLIATIHELFNLITNSKDVTESASFRKIYKQLNPNSKKSIGI